MSVTATRATPTYLREARLAAGYANRDAASTDVPFSPETIGRHERGDVPIAPYDAIVYAQSYKRRDILIRYCADCPVGQATGRKVTERDLPMATMRLTQRLRKAAKDVAATLEEIADDGIVDSSERRDFDNALSVLREISETITDIVLYAATQGVGGSPEGEGRR